MSGETILVVEDSPTDLRLMTGALAPKGYQVHTAVDGEEALTKAASLRPRLVVLDVVLPKVNGFQVCRQLKTDPETRGIKVLMVTSKNQETDRFWGMKQGADEYLIKPFDAAELQSAVARLL
jgi:twitching motility two-component system response regulator PilH